MTQRLRFVLDGDDQLSPVLNRAGDASVRLHRRLDDDMDGNARAVRQFTQDANGRLRDLQGRFVSVADASRLMGGGMPDLARRLGDVSAAGGDAAASLGRSGGGLGGVMGGVAAVAGLSLLPAIGALVPMMAGGALAAGTLKLGFAGVADAVALAGEDTEKYNEALKKMGPEQRTFTEALVDLKKQFGPIGREVQKAMLPGFTKAVQSAGPVVKILGGAMTELGGAFGDAAEGVGRMLKDSGFQDSLQQNLRLGSIFVRDMTSAMGPFIRSLLDFGAASEPTLRAFSNGISGLLSKGLPGFFQGLQTGVGGAAKFLDGLFDSINTLLPALGRLSGEVARTTGPIFGELFRAFGNAGAGAMDTLRRAIVLLRPVLRDIGYGLKTINDVGRIIAPTMRDTASAIIGAFAPAGQKIDQTAGPLQRLNQWVNNNKASIMEMGRQFGNALIMMVDMAVAAAPEIIKGFRLAATGILGALDVIVSGAAKAFGWIPGIGPKLKAANADFDAFKGSFIAGLSAAEQKARDFAGTVRPRLSANQLKMNINNWNAQLEEAKRKLKSVPPSKQAALKATIKDLEAKIRSANRQLNAINGKTANTYINNIITTVRRERAEASTLNRPYRGEGGYSKNAAGGPVEAGEVSLVGENGPELVVFGEAGRVIDATATRSMLRGTLGAGRAAAQGLAAGLGSTAGVHSAARTMAGAVTAGIKDELQIASPSKKTKALAQDVARGFLEGLTGSRSKIKAVTADLAKDIKTAFSGHKESRLLRMVKDGAFKQDYQAKTRDWIKAKIAEAKVYAGTVMNTARSGATLGNLGLEPEQVTAGGIKGAMNDKLSKIKQFTSYIKTLASRGLHKTLLRQILDMGPEQGYAYASALAGADKATLSAISRTQHGLDTATRSLGEIGADRLYDAGRNAGRGFLKGLEGQQKQVEDLMMRIAKSMQKSIKRALGIRSPSTVMAQLGVFTTQGLARGLTQGLPWVDRAMDTVSGRITTRPSFVGRPAVAASARGGMTVHVSVQVSPTADRIAIGKEIQKALLELKRNTGGGQLGLT